MVFADLKAKLEEVVGKHKPDQLPMASRTYTIACQGSVGLVFGEVKNGEAQALRSLSICHVTSVLGKNPFEEVRVNTWLREVEFLCTVGHQVQSSKLFLQSPIEYCIGYKLLYNFLYRRTSDLKL